MLHRASAVPNGGFASFLRQDLITFGDTLPKAIAVAGAPRRDRGVALDVDLAGCGRTEANRRMGPNPPEHCGQLPRLDYGLLSLRLQPDGPDSWARICAPAVACSCPTGEATEVGTSQV